MSIRGNRRIIVVCQACDGEYILNKVRYKYLFTNGSESTFTDAAVVSGMNSTLQKTKVSCETIKATLFFAYKSAYFFYF